MGGIALKNGVVLVSERHWAAAVRNVGGDISVASGCKPRLPGTGGSGQAGRVGHGSEVRGERGQWNVGGSDGVPLLRGLGRFGESLLVLAQVKTKLPQSQLPLEGGRVAGALIAAAATTSAVKALAPKSALVQETGMALAAFVPAILALRNSPISGYHGAEHKVIGGREAALRSSRSPSATGVARRPVATSGGRLQAPEGQADTTAGTSSLSAASTPRLSASAVTAKEHDRCGSNLVGPYLLATVATNLLTRGNSGRKSPAASAVAGAFSLGVALEALRWATRNGDSLLAGLLLLPGRAIQKRISTTEPTFGQLEVGERALAELLRVEDASDQPRR
jgi:hypothetical protein